MQKDERQTRAKRLRWGIAAVLLLAVGVSAYFIVPRGLRGPERNAGEFLEALIHAPADATRLRNAAHIGAADDPQALLQGQSTDVTLSFLRARQAQGMAQDVAVIARQQPTAQAYTVTLRVSDAAAGDAASLRYFIVQLERTADDNWRVVSVRTAD